MTNQQLYFAIGLPILVYLLSFTAMVFVVLWQGKELREDIREIRGDLKLIVGALNELDKRVSLIEERLERLER